MSSEPAPQQSPAADPVVTGGERRNATPPIPPAISSNLAANLDREAKSRPKQPIFSPNTLASPPRAGDNVRSWTGIAGSPEADLKSPPAKFPPQVRRSQSQDLPSISVSPLRPPHRSRAPSAELLPAGCCGTCCNRCHTRCRCYVADRATQKFLQVEVASLICAGAAVGAGFAVKRYAEDEEVIGMPISSILLLIAYVLVLGIPGRFLNWLIYFLFDRCCRARLLTTFAYYATTLDGPLGNVIAIIAAWATYRKIAPVTDPMRLNQLFGFALVYFLATAIQSIVLRAALSGVLQTAFRKKVEAVNFRRQALLALTHPLTLRQRIEQLRNMSAENAARYSPDNAMLYGILPGAVRQLSDTSVNSFKAVRATSFGSAGAAHRSSLTGIAGVDESYLEGDAYPGDDNAYDFRKHLVSLEHTEFKLFDGNGALVPIYGYEDLRSIARNTFHKLLQVDLENELHLESEIIDDGTSWEEMEDEMRRKIQRKRHFAKLREVATSVVPVDMANRYDERAGSINHVENVAPPAPAPYEEHDHAPETVVVDPGSGNSGSGNNRSGSGVPASLRLHRRPSEDDRLAPLPSSQAWQRFTSKAQTYGSARGFGGVELPKTRRTSTLAAPIRVVPNAADTADKLTFDHLRAQIGRSGAEAFFPMLDIGTTYDYTLYEFYRVFQNIYEEWLGIRSSLHGHQNVSGAIRFLADLVFYIIMFVVVLIIFQINIVDSFVGIAAILVPSSFVFQGPVSNAINSITFIVGQRPFDVGDWVAIDYDGLPNNEYMKVLEINLLACVFETLTGRRVQLPNSLLATLPIENHSRSQNATFILLFEVGIATSTEQFSQLSDRLLAYMKSKPLEWKPDLCSYCNFGNYERGVMELEFWATHQLPWAEIDAVFASQSDITMTILDIMNSLDITYRKPTQPVAFHTTLHAGIHGNVDVSDPTSRHQDDYGDEDNEDLVSEPASAKQERMSIGTSVDTGRASSSHQHDPLRSNFDAFRPRLKSRGFSTGIRMPLGGVKSARLRKRGSKSNVATPREDS